MNTSNCQTRFCIIGCGRLGVSLAVFLSGKGFVPKAFFSRTRESAQFARDMAGQGQVYEDAVSASQSCDLVFIRARLKKIFLVYYQEASRHATIRIIAI